MLSYVRVLRAGVSGNTGRKKRRVGTMPVMLSDARVSWAGVAGTAGKRKRKGEEGASAVRACRLNASVRWLWRMPTKDDSRLDMGKVQTVVF
jgi:hypothetical protein